jgi:chromosome segregation ATPase
MADLEAAHTALLAQLDQAEAVASQLRGRAAEAEAEAALAARQRQEAEAALGGERAQVAAATTALAVLRNRLIATEEAAKHSEHALREQEAGAKRVQDSLQASLASAAATERSRSSTVGALEGHVLDQTKRADSLAQELAEARRALQASEEAQARAAIHGEALAREVTRLQVSLDTAQRREDREVQAAQGAARHSAQHYELQLSHNQKMIKGIQRQRSDLQRQLTEARMENQILRQQLDEMQRGVLGLGQWTPSKDSPSRSPFPSLPQSSPL